MNEIINTAEKASESEITAQGAVTASGIVLTMSGMEVLSTAGLEIGEIYKDKHVGNFALKKSANAWWNDFIKVGELVQGFKIGLDINKAMVYANISQGQWNYFVDNHPHFYEIKSRCLSYVNLRAHTKLYNDVQENVESAKFWLKTHDQQYQNDKRGPEIVVPIQNNTVINNGEAINEEKVIDIVARITGFRKPTASGVLASEEVPGGDMEVRDAEIVGPVHE